MEEAKRSETIVLEYPIRLADRVVTEVTMRRPSMKDLRKYRVKGPDDVDGEFRQFAALCGLRPEEMEEMDSADYARFQNLYVRFRTPSERGGDPDGRAGALPHDALEPARSAGSDV
jgi:hypothetical protein